MSAIWWSSPWPLPGQIAQVDFQAASVRRLESQKGHVRHCLGARPIDGAFPFFSVEEDTIPVGKFLETFPNTDQSNKLAFELDQVFFANFSGQILDFLFVDPNVSRSSGTTVAALAAFEA